MDAHIAGNAVRLYLDECGLKYKVRARTSNNPFGGADKIFVTIKDADKEVLAHEPVLTQMGRDRGFCVQFDGVVYAANKDGVKHGTYK